MKEKIKKIKKKITFEKIVYYTIIAFMIALPFCKFLSYALYTYKVLDYYLIRQAMVLWVFMPLLIIYYLYGVLSEKYELNKFDYFMIVIIILNILSTVFSVDFKKSVFGEEKRDEGILTLLNYYFLFLNGKNIKNKKFKENIINLFILLGIFQTFYSILEVYGNFKFVKKYILPYMAMGLCANPNFLGLYIVMHLLITTTLYSLKKEKKYLIYSIYFFICLFLAGSTGPFIASILSIIFFIIVYRKKLKFKNIAILLVSLVATYFLTDATNNIVQSYVFNEEIDSSYSISKDIETFNKKEDTDISNGRLEVWKKSLPLVKEYPIFGSGPDTFGDVYPNTGQIFFDKAHNVYIQILITNGLPAFIIYMLMFFFLFLDSFRIKDIYGISIFLGFVGYSIAAFTGISIVDVTPYYFLLSGLILTYVPSKAHN